MQPSGLVSWVVGCGFEFEFVFVTSSVCIFWFYFVVLSLCVFSHLRLSVVFPLCDCLSCPDYSHLCLVNAPALPWIPWASIPTAFPLFSSTFLVFWLDFFQVFWDLAWFQVVDFALGLNGFCLPGLDTYLVRTLACLNCLWVHFLINLNESHCLRCAHLASILFWAFAAQTWH